MEEESMCSCQGPFPEVCFWADLQQGGGEREGSERRRDE